MKREYRFEEVSIEKREKSAGKYTGIAEGKEALYALRAHVPEILRFPRTFSPLAHGGFHTPVH